MVYLSLTLPVVTFSINAIFPCEALEIDKHPLNSIYTITFSCNLFPSVLVDVFSSCFDDVFTAFQEEYMVGDEMGKLRCEHRFHIECIDQWLRQKNWCPICKASALPSGSSPKQAAGGANHFVWSLCTVEPAGARALHISPCKYIKMLFIFFPWNKSQPWEPSSMPCSFLAQ